MSFFNKMLAKVGIGSAEVDTLLEKDSYVPGEEVSGVVRLKGGSVDQKVDRIYIQLMTRYIRESDDKKYTEHYCLAKVNVTGAIDLKSGEQMEIPFSFSLPLETPVTYSGQPVWLHTGLDIEVAVDPSDKDGIEVKPHPYMEVVFQAVQSLGFRFRTATCEYSRYGHGVPFEQEFEFLPGSSFSSRIKELELVMTVDQGGIHVRVEIDRKARGLSGIFEQALDMDERHGKVYFSASDLRSGPETVARTLESWIVKQSR
ncbi:sporulation protein [Paenibacillus sp. N1-5-1-14]|uniref:sporulation protein n=1 Tax=Paenibacillus radicibacter TaxID=2972488 RepID=UPI00215977AB|nr:sporulation protein [Paenibacillus radicibacter]MCR8642222.1 sporulation protein [Paenibacillus radicibacter]